VIRALRPHRSRTQRFFDISAVEFFTGISHFSRVPSASKREGGCSLKFSAALMISSGTIFRSKEDAGRPTRESFMEGDWFAALLLAEYTGFFFRDGGEAL
jgi:hypothetical protein